MPRPGDWDAIGLSTDPTPGDPETISQLAEIFQNLGHQAREIYNAIETVMNTADDSVFAGATAEALRGKVDNRLRGHVEDVAWAFETSAQALRDWHNVVVEQQGRADAALNAGRGLAEDDPERQRQTDIARQAGEYQAEQGQSVAGRIRTVSHISLPVSACQIFWEAFQWLAIILIIPALVFGGPIALFALGVNLTLFLKTAVDFANGDARFLDLFLAGLGLIAPTTKALPIFSILKGVGKALVTGAKGLFQGVRQIFTRDFLFTRLLPGLSHLPFIASVAIRDTGLFVLTGLRQVVGFGAGLLRSPVQFTLGALRGAHNLNVSLLRGIYTGTAFAWGKTWSGIKAGAKFAWQELGSTRFLRLILPVDVAEIRAFGFWGALKIGVVNRGLLGQHVFGAPLTGAIGRGISAIPMTPPTPHAALDGLGSLAPVLSSPPVLQPGIVHLGSDLTALPGHGFHAAKAVDGLDGIRLTDVVNVRSGDLGLNVVGTTSITPSGLHLPANAGTPAAVNAGTPAVVNVASGTPSTFTVATATPAPVNVPGSLGVGSRIGDSTTHALVANQVRLHLDELVSIPPATQLSVDRVGAALQLVDNTKPAPQVGVNLAQRTEVPLSGMPGRPDVFVRIEKQGDLISHQLFNGGPNGRIDPLPGGQLRYTDTGSGHTALFDAKGKLVGQPAAPVEVKTTSRWDADLAARADLFRRAGDTDSAVQARMADWTRIQQSQQHVDATRMRLDSLAARPDSSSAGHPLDHVRVELGRAEKTLNDLKTTFLHTHGLDPDTIGRSLDNLVVASVNDRPRAVGGVLASSSAGPAVREIQLTGIPGQQNLRVRVETVSNTSTYHLVDGNGLNSLDTLPAGHLRLTRQGTGETFHFDATGQPISRGTRLTGVPGQADRVVVLHPGGNLALTDLAGQGIDGMMVRRAGQSDFRITHEDGVSHRFGADGAFRGESLSLVDGNGLRGQWFVEPGPNGGVRIVGNDGTPRPGAAAHNLGDGRTLVVDSTGGTLYWRDGTPGGPALRVDNALHITMASGQLRTFHLDGTEFVAVRSQTIAPFGGHVARDNGGLRWYGDAGPVSMPHRTTPTATGGVRLEVDLPGTPRHGEFHEFDSAGKVVKQGFPVARDGRATSYSYVVDHLDGTWSRVNRADGSIGSGDFHHGKLDKAGLENGRIRLMSSTGKSVEVFERRWLPDGVVLDSFRRTDTLGFGKVNRSTTWTTYDSTGTRTGWGTRHFDTTGAGWRDVDQSWRTIREYREGLQKYHSSTGHVLALRQDDGWKWFKYDDHAALVAQGDRRLERIGDGWTDTITRRVGGQDVTDVAQQKWGKWHLPETADQYQEFILTRGANGVDRPGTWVQHARQGKESGSAATVSNELMTVIRHGEQRPPVLVRNSPLIDNPRPTGIAAHLADDNQLQLFHWKHGANEGGVRYTAMDGAITDLDAQGNFVRSSGTLSDGTKLKVGGDARPPQVPYSNNGIPWEAGADRGYRLVNGTDWTDVKQVNGTWEVVRESRPGGVVREYHDVPARMLWTERDAHGNLTGLSTRNLERPGFFVQATGAADSARWTWNEIDPGGNPVPGRGGDRQFFRGSTDDSLSWDDSFRDFDAADNLVRDRRMLDGGRYVESWWTTQGWKSGEFDRLGRPVAGTTPLNRVWSTGDGVWHDDWVKGAVFSRDQRPPTGNLGPQVVRETPVHLSGGGPLRVREYVLDGNGVTQYGQWKEFDHGTVVRQRKLSGADYLETDAWRGQWKRYDAQGNLLGERLDSGLVFEMRNGKLHLTGNEYDFRGPLTEMRGWGRRVREAQRMPWMSDSDWTLRGSTLTPYGDAVREARYASAFKVIGQKAMLEFAQEFVLEFTANLIVNAIVAAAQNKPFSGNDALKALLNAGVTSTIKTGIGSALGDTKLGGELRNLKLGLANVDSGKHWNRRPLNHDKFWGNEWGGNEAATRWRGGMYDFSFNLGPSVLSGFVNGTINAAVFGVSNADGTTVKLSGVDAVRDGGINALASLTTGVSTALVKNVALGFGGSRFFHRQGFGDFWLQLPFRVFEKSIQAMFLTSTYRASINPSYFQVPSGLVLPTATEGSQ